MPGPLRSPLLTPRPEGELDQELLGRLSGHVALGQAGIADGERGRRRGVQPALEGPGVAEQDRGPLGDRGGGVAVGLTVGRAQPLLPGSGPRRQPARGRRAGCWRDRGADLPGLARPMASAWSRRRRTNSGGCSWRPCGAHGGLAPGTAGPLGDGVPLDGRPSGAVAGAGGVWSGIFSRSGVSKPQAALRQRPRARRRARAHPPRREDRQPAPGASPTHPSGHRGSPPEGGAPASRTAVKER